MSNDRHINFKLLRDRILSEPPDKKYWRSLEELADSPVFEEFVRREFSPGVKPAGIKAIWWITAIILLALCLALYFFKS